MRAHARWLFGSAAALNFALATALLFLFPRLAPVLRLDAANGTNVVMVNATGALIATFGVAYVLLAVDPVRHRVFVPLAILGKLLVVAVVAWPWLAGAVPWTLPALTGADVVYAALFLHFLRKTSAQQRDS
ncbi:MAG TPA: hypothetical protein VFF06_04555 [Polyangia bacterium]|nr:hypothetical protein [Polyangia bacterium]